MTTASSPVRILLATTEGPAAIEAITRENDALDEAVALVGATRLAGISAAYDAFAGPPRNAVAGLCGARSWRLDLSRDIEAGDSWQAGVLIGHLLAAEQRLAPTAAAPATVLWITGALDHDNGTFVAVDHCQTKLAASIEHLVELRRAGCRVLAVLPVGNAADVGDALLARAAAAGIELHPVRHLDEAARLVDLSLPRRQVAPRSGRRLGLAAAAAAAAVAAGLLLAVAWPRPHPLPFRQCPHCPEMVALPARLPPVGEAAGPPPARLAFGRYAVTVAEFEAFVAATGRDVKASCNLPRLEGSYGWDRLPRTFREPSYAVTPRHPVTCVSYDDAIAYAAWLSAVTGRRYRLPSSREHEFATRAGTSTAYAFGGDEKQLCSEARFAHLGTPIGQLRGARFDCPGQPGHGPLPVGSFPPNAWGLYDMHGNVWEWVSDCAAEGGEVEASAPESDAAPLLAPQCAARVIRGGGYNSLPQHLTSAYFDTERQDRRNRSDAKGFRVVVELD